jgi:ubiquinone/menaquinone biosynthesis C-methylase UbiE
MQVGRSNIRQAYRDPEESRNYIETRFVEPLGAILHARQARVLKRVIASTQPERVLEIAPGPARLTTEVASLVRRGIALDGSRPMLDIARQRLRENGGDHWRLLNGDAFELPFTRAFNLVYTFRLIRHFDETDRRRLYEQIRRVLLDGGVLVFDAINELVAGRHRASAPDSAGSIRYYDALLTMDQVKGELQATGFEVVSMDGVQHHYPVLQQIQNLAAPRSRMLARAAMELVDRTGGEPAEWVVTARVR